MLLLSFALAAEPPDLTGLWRVDLEVQTRATVPVLGGTTITTHQVMLATVRRGPDGAFVQTHDTCDMRATSSRAFTRPALPRAFVDAMPNKTYPLVLTEQAGTWRVAMDFRPLYVGFDGVRSGGAVPQGPDDPTIIDWDRDGRPGATIQVDLPLIGAVEVYQVQRGHTTVDATVRSPDLIEGTVDVGAFAQRTIGASNSLFVQNPKIESLSDRATFRQVRLPEGTTCAALSLGG